MHTWGFVILGLQGRRSSGSRFMKGADPCGQRACSAGIFKGRRSQKDRRHFYKMIPPENIFDLLSMLYYILSMKSHKKSRAGIC